MVKVITTVLPGIMCPSRRENMLYPAAGAGQLNVGYAANVIHTDYACNGGDNTVVDATQTGQPGTFAQGDAGFTYPPSNGTCVPRAELKLRQITDGLSKTYLIGEKYLQPELYTTGNDAGDNENALTGLNWDNARTASTGGAPCPRRIAGLSFALHAAAAGYAGLQQLLDLGQHPLGHVSDGVCRRFGAWHRILDRCGAAPPVGQSPGYAGD